MAMVGGVLYRGGREGVTMEEKKSVRRVYGFFIFFFQIKAWPWLSVYSVR